MGREVRDRRVALVVEKGVLGDGRNAIVRDHSDIRSDESVGAVGAVVFVVLVKADNE